MPMQLLTQHASGQLLHRLQAAAFCLGVECMCSSWKHKIKQGSDEPRWPGMLPSDAAALVLLPCGMME